MKRIIFVEDDPGIQDSVKMSLERVGYDVEVMIDGNDILENNFTSPDLFILDKQLVGVDGLDICRFLKSMVAVKDVPVIMLSASPSIKRLAAAAGANDALEKPFKMDLLRSMVAKYVENR